MTLLDKISSVEHLEKAWRQLHKLNKDSHGLSGETIDSFEKNKEVKLKSISLLLKEKKYKFLPTRGVLIPKNEKNKFRPLQIPEVSDRVVIKAIAIILEEIFLPLIQKSEGYSFAYQDRIGVKDALLKIKEHYNAGYQWALEADLVNFFGTVNRSLLLKNIIFKRLTDDSLNDLITNALSQKVGNIDSFSDEHKQYFQGIENGIPQGNALSPLLSNIYLSDFDSCMIENNYNLVRYADDFVVLCQSQQDCTEAYQIAEAALNNLDLKVHPLSGSNDGKTKITNIEKQSLTFLSVTFDGLCLYPSLSNFERLKNKIWDLNKSRDSLTLLEYLRKLKNKHEGWISAFIYTDINRYSEELDFQINRALYLKLNNIDWKLSEKKLDIVPKKYSSKESSRYCLSKIQRDNSGIPSSSILIAEKKAVSSI